MLKRFGERIAEQRHYFFCGRAVWTRYAVGKKDEFLGQLSQGFEVSLVQSFDKLFWQATFDDVVRFA